MADELSPDDVKRVRALLGRVELRGVRFHEYSASLYQEQAKDVEKDAVNVSLELQHRIEDEGFAIRVKFTLRLEIGEVVVSVAADYGVSDGGALVKRDVLMFANEVALMTLFPYAREGISELTNKVMGSRVLLPITQRGEVAFDVDEGESEINVVE